MRIRRIFRPAPTDPRRWAPFAAGLGAVLTVAVLAVALPGDLLGSAPKEQSWSAPAAEVRVLDGDTLRLGDRVLRLHALEVPERGRATCRGAGGGPQDCAAAAADLLARLVAERDVECRVRGRDRLGRALGICRARGSGAEEVELNASLVAAGWAVADSAALPALGALEAAARQGGRGLWAPGATLPDAWRRRF